MWRFGDGNCKSGKESFWDVWAVWNRKKQAGDSNVSNRITEYRRSGLPGIKSWQFLYQSMQEKPPVEGSLYEGSEDDFENVR